MRRLPKTFMNDLKNEDGKLYPLLERIKKDDTLLLSIRNNYINIYYRGGNLVRISYGAKGYKAFFDEGKILKAIVIAFVIGPIASFIVRWISMGVLWGISWLFPKIYNWYAEDLGLELKKPFI